MDCPSHELLAELAEGRQEDPDLQRQWEEHLRSCRSCAHRLELMQEAAELLKTPELLGARTKGGMDHPNPGRLHAFAEGGLDPEEIQELVTHLNLCRDCQELISDLIGDDQEEPPKEATSPLSREQIELVLDRALGQGSTGTRSGHPVLWICATLIIGLMLTLVLARPVYHEGEVRGVARRRLEEAESIVQAMNRTELAGLRLVPLSLDATEGRLADWTRSYETVVDHLAELEEQPGLRPRALRASARCALTKEEGGHRAYHLLTKAMRADPTDAAVLCDLGTLTWAVWQDGRAAGELFEEALRQDSDLEEALFNRAVLGLELLQSSGEESWRNVSYRIQEFEDRGGDPEKVEELRDRLHLKR